MGDLVKTTLKHLRYERELPQWQVAVLAEVEQARLSILERGCPPRPSEAKKLARFFKVSVHRIWPDLEVEVVGD